LLFAQTTQRRREVGEASAAVLNENDQKAAPTPNSAAASLPLRLCVKSISAREAAEILDACLTGFRSGSYGLACAPLWRSGEVESCFNFQ